MPVLSSTIDVQSEQYRVNPADVDVGRLEMLLGAGRVIYSGK